MTLSFFLPFLQHRDPFLETQLTLYFQEGRAKPRCGIFLRFEKVPLEELFPEGLHGFVGFFVEPIGIFRRRRLFFLRNDQDETLIPGRIGRADVARRGPAARDLEPLDSRITSDGADKGWGSFGDGIERVQAIGSGDLAGAGRAAGSP